MTKLRLIPHAKRGKLDGIKTPHGRLGKVTKGTDDLTPYGARSDLLTSGDERFLELLFDCVSNQARTLARGEWKLHRCVGEFVLVIVGGSTQSCVAVGIGGKTFVRELGSEGIDCVSVIHSDDSDAFAGISMQAIYHLESTCVQRGKQFKGAIYLHGPNKSVSQITKLGDIFKTNIEVDRELCPTGRGFHFMVDLIAVYYTLEQDSRLPELPFGHRAMSCVSVVYTLLESYCCSTTHSLIARRRKSFLKRSTPLMS